MWLALDGDSLVVGVVMVRVIILYDGCKVKLVMGITTGLMQGRTGVFAEQMQGRTGVFAEQMQGRHLWAFGKRI